MAGRLSGRVTVAGGAVVAVGLCAAAAATTPFTPGAEATVAAGFVAVLALVPLRRSGLVPLATRPDGRGEPDDPRRWGWRWAVVVVPLVGALAWELVCVAHGDRSAWPTLSSLLDDVDRSPLGRGVACAVWLGLGWALVTG